MHAVIMAGGRGTRFWPRSRERKPKHLLDILSEKTIIQQTVSRIQCLVPPENILIVTGRKHARDVIQQLPDIPAQNILIEPEGKNTAACIGLAALHIQKRIPDDVMIVLPSDHAIADAQKYLTILKAAATAAARQNALITIGIKPTSIQTGFGYLEQDLPGRSIGGEKMFRVKSIREKPDYETAKRLVEQGTFFWNSGMFIWKTSVILHEIERWLPDLHKGLMDIQSSLGSPQEKKTVSRVYKSLSSVSIDYGVMEKATHVFMFTGDFGWNDVGSWDAVWDISDKDPHGNVHAGSSRVIFEDTRDSLVYSPHKLVATVGVKDLVIVETKDALLICQKGRSQDVKKIVEHLEKKGLKKYL